MAKDATTPSVEIVVNGEGVFAVRLIGRSWDDEPRAAQIYERIAHLVREIDRVVRSKTSERVN